MNSYTTRLFVEREQEQRPRPASNGMNAGGEKIRVGLMTYAIDGRKAKGTAVVARKSVEALLRARNQFELTFLHFERSDDAIYSHGVREVMFPVFRLRYLNHRFFRMTYYFLTTKDRYDVVEWFQSRLYPFFWLAPARYIVAALHGAGDLTPDGRFILSRTIFNWTIKLFNKKISMAIAGSEYAKKDIVAKYGFGPARVVAINFGVEAAYRPADSAAIEEVRNKYHLPKKFFLGMARHIPTKNVVRTFQAFDRYCATAPHSDFHFVHVGVEDVETPELQKIIEESPSGDRFHLITYVEQQDLAAIYSAAYALVFPLLNEGFSLPPLEAMACGTPAIISKTAAPEITGDDAILVDPYHVDEIADAMRRLAVDPSLRERFAKNGLAKAKQFTWERMGEKLIGVYDELMRG